MKVEAFDDRHDRAGFTSGVLPLDRYFRAQARQDTGRRVVSCFLLAEADTTFLAYYTLAATSLALTDLPASTAKRLPRYPLVPATLLRRLAVDHRHCGRRLGEHMLLDACARALRNEIATFAVIVDAKDGSAAAFYSAYDFVPLDAGARRLFLPMTTMARLFTWTNARFKRSASISSPAGFYQNHPESSRFVHHQ